MNIEVRGKSKHISKAEVKFATAFFAQYLMGPKLAKNIDRDVTFFNPTGVSEGFCSPVDAERRPRHFEILVKADMARHKTLKIMAHEMVHAKQYARNELSNELITAKWKGKTYHISGNIEDYLNYPWEIEAFGREHGMYLLYALMIAQEKITFKHGHVYMRGKRLSKKTLTSSK